jgi:hypothetical protein
MHPWPLAPGHPPRLVGVIPEREGPARDLETPLEGDDESLAEWERRLNDTCGACGVRALQPDQSGQGRRCRACGASKLSKLSKRGGPTS